MQVQTLHLPFDVPLLPSRLLSAGNLTCLYEHGALRYIRVHGKHIVQMIYSAVRDENWATAPYVIEDETIQENEAGFTIQYTAFYQLNQIRYKAHFEIEGKGDTISFSMEGVALNDFQTNRIGLCILHPIEECAGKKVVITQPGRSTYDAVFPELISPHQPFKQVQQMCWSTSGANAELTFEGDVFETEDQRNWTDASYKTYSRPLELPFPYAVNAGESITQRVTLKVSADEELTIQTGEPHLEKDEIKVPFPAIGYCRPKGSTHLTAAEINLLLEVPFDHYRIELCLNEDGWETELANAVSEAQALQTKLELVIFAGLNPERELQGLIEMLSPFIAHIESILPLHYQQKIASPGLFARMYNTFKAAFPQVEVGYGTDRFFADLNRNRPSTPDYDFVSFSLNPQVHAVDTRSLIENLAAQQYTIATANAFTRGKPIHVSPVTFKIRTNDGKDYDERMRTSFGAGWTLQAIKNLSGAKRITLYETLGAKGIINQIEPSTDETQQAEILLTPLYQVLKDIKDFQPVYNIHQNSNNETSKSVLLENKKGDRLLFNIDNPQL